MPNINRMGTPYVSTGNPDSVNDASLYAGGELGVAYDENDRTYQIVKLDSGATAAASLLPAANQLLYWKDRANYIVTNDINQAKGKSAANSAFRNQVAGILRNAATPGYYIHMLIRGRKIAVKSTEANATIGYAMVSDTTNTAVSVAAGTAPTVRPIGYQAATGTGAYVYTDVDLTNIP